MARVFTSSASEYLVNTGVAPVSNHPLTMACWTKVVGFSGDDIWMHAHDTASTVRGFYLSARSTRVNMFYWDTAGDGSATTTAPTTGVWEHYCGVVIDGNTWHTYLNGGSKGTNGATGKADNTCDDFYVGGRGFVGSSVDSHVNGTIAEAAVWNAALTDAEVATLAAGYSPLLVRPSALVFYDPMVRGVDADGGGNSRDIVGGLAMTENGTDIESAAHPRIIYPARPSIITAPAAAPAGNNLAWKLAATRPALAGVGGLAG